MNIQKYWKNIPTQFLKISRVLPPRRIFRKPCFIILAPIQVWSVLNLEISRVQTPKRTFRKPGFYYINSNSGFIYPKFGRILSIISIGTWIYKNIEKPYPDSVFGIFIFFLLNFFIYKKGEKNLQGINPGSKRRTI